MKVEIARLSPIAAAVGLVLGSGIALAQQTRNPSPDQQPTFEQPSPEQLPNTDPQVRSRDQELQSQDPQSQSQDRDSQLGDRESQSRNEESRPQPQNRETQSAQGETAFEQVAERNPELSKFVEAINAAGLADALTNGSDYTIFAPTNDALDGKDIDAMLEPDKRSELVALLRAHIVADDVDREMAGRIGRAQTIDGGTVDISVGDDEKIMIGEAEANDSDIEIGNLRVYAVDEVLPSNPSYQSARNDRQPSDEQRDQAQPQGIPQ